MRGLRADNQGVRVIADLPDPSPGPGEAVVRVRLAGVAASDARLVLGDSRFVGIPGHELVGIVEQINIPDESPPALREKKSLKGKRVVASPHVVCGHCDRCRSGLSAHCRSRQVIGLAPGGWGGGGGGASRDGCLAERICLPVANLVPVPDAVPDEAAVLAVPLACAMHTQNMLRGETDAYITILGDNLLSLLTAQYLARSCQSLRALVSLPEHVRILERWGIKHRLVDEAGRRQDQAVVVDCTGTASGLRLSMQHVRPRGLIVLKSPAGNAAFLPGVPLSPTTDPAWTTAIDLTPLVSNEIRVHGSRDGSVADAVRAIAGGEVDLAGLVTKRYPITQGVEALKAAGDGTKVKVVVEFEQR